MSDEKMVDAIQTHMEVWGEEGWGSEHAFVGGKAGELNTRRMDRDKYTPEVIGNMGAASIRLYTLAANRLVEDAEEDPDTIEDGKKRHENIFKASRAHKRAASLASDLADEVGYDSFRTLADIHGERAYELLKRMPEDGPFRKEGRVYERSG